MELTKFEHACVRLEKDGKILVIDPGAFSRQDALEGAHTVLITHEHFDHFEPERLAALPADAEIYACETVAANLDEAGVAAKVRAVRHGDGFETAGFRIDVVGEWHINILPELPAVQNVGYLVEEEVFYPGDAFTPPGREIGTLLVPTGAPWLTLADVMGYLREVRPTRAFSTHDALYSDLGLKVIDKWLDMEADRQKREIRRLPVGQAATL